MTILKQASRIMENTTAYRFWQSPFLHQKFEPVLAHNDLSTVRRILDVGCGPGTNCVYFEGIEYLGIDINECYIDYARKKYHREFIAADVTEFQVPDDEKFDFVLSNSLLHHLDDQGVDSLLASLSNVLADDGCVHIIDLVLPEQRGLPRFLASNDRGDFGRPLEHWKSIFERHFESLVFEPFNVDALGVSLWNLIYFKGRAIR